VRILPVAQRVEVSLEEKHVVRTGKKTPQAWWLAAPGGL